MGDRDISVHADGHQVQERGGAGPHIHRQPDEAQVPQKKIYQQPHKLLRVKEPTCLAFHLKYWFRRLVCSTSDFFLSFFRSLFFTHFGDNQEADVLLALIF